MRIPRFHVATAAAGARLLLTDHAAHHAKDVLRLVPGDRIRVFDGRGTEFEATVSHATRRVVEAQIERLVTPRPESSLELTLALAPLKGDLMDLVIQKATELGVSSILPLVTARTDAVARAALDGSRLERWRKVASSAAEQCGRAVVPVIEPATRLATSPEPRGAGVVLEAREGIPSLLDLDAPTGPVTILVGPAGGLESSGIVYLVARGFAAASFGPRILRAETAAIAAVAAAQLLWGDLG